ncbi:MAG: High-affinity nickel transporter [Planctomycetes bacterium]|nr:High-affinity nickel transporter [Planctomycetota bacterium]
MLALFAGLVAGAVHVVTGPDHLAAVAPLSVETRGAAWKAGLRWGIGHSAGVGLVGIAALALREALPIDVLSSFSERLVGVTLVGLGLWGLVRLFGSRARAVEQRHAHDATAHSHERPLRLALGFGTLHGLAGSSHVLGVVPALALPTRTDAVLYLAAFALGTVGAMVVAAATIGALGARKQRFALGATSFAALGVGVLWLVAPFG